jgi:hypothetical protein
VRLANDGSLLVGAMDAVHRVDPRTGKRARWLATPGGAGPIEMSPDRATAFVGDGKRVHVVPIAAKPKPAATLSVNGDGVMSIGPSPDGKQVLVVGNDEGGILKCYVLGKSRARYTIGSVRYAKTAWLADGARYVTASIEWNACVRVHDAATGETVVDLGDPYPGADDTYGPGVDAIAVVGEHAIVGSKLGLMKLPLAGGKPTWLDRGPEVGALALAGDRIVASFGDGIIRTFAGAKVAEQLSAGPGIVDLDAYAGKLAWVRDGVVGLR